VSDRALLREHRRALIWSGVLLVATVGMLLAVGKHPTAAAPETTWPLIGHIDQGVYDLVQRVRIAPAAWFAVLLGVIGSGFVTVPLRILASLYLAYRRWWPAFAAFVATWAVAEISLTLLKLWLRRGRPPDPLVATHGFSFPSGHSVAGASIAISLVLAFVNAGPGRRAGELGAGVFLVAMGLSRVVVNAHWLSDVVTGVLVGSAAAVLCAGLAAEVAQRLASRGHRDGPSPTPA